jgi:rhodanese-related sulfurtransferase
MADTLQADALRITASELKRRLLAGEDFVFIDTRNPQAWAQSDRKARNAIRVPLENLEENISRIPKDQPIVAYCT